MNKNNLWPLVISNSICIICWTALAIVFNKWWIAFFSVLFMSSSPVQYFYRYCDNCGKHSPYAYSYNEAFKKAKEAGWIHCVDGNKDYCPECQQEIFKEQINV